MFSYDFRTHGEDKAVYGPGPLYRVICIIFFVLLLLGLISVLATDSWTQSAIIPVVVLLLLLFCILYRDLWIFDNKGKCVIYIWGFGPFVKKEVWKYKDIERIEVTHFIKGIPDTAKKQEPSWRHKAQVVLSLRLDEDNKKDLEIMGEKKSGGKLERNASWLAGFTSISLFVDRPSYSRNRI